MKNAMNKGMKMNNWFNQKFFVVAMIAGAAFANEKTEQLNTKLDSIEQAQTGVSFSGQALGRALSAEKYGSGLQEGDPSRENLFFTQMDLSIQGRPSTETQATLIFRLHQDWNNYYDEGVNGFNTRWMSYDGQIKLFNNDMMFNLGDFRFKKSPLVAYVPDLMGLEYEAEVFERKREEAAADRFQGDNLRHLQGINATYILKGSQGTHFDMSATGAQLRFPWWSNGILQYDNDDAAKYLAHIDGELTIKGLIKAGASFTSVFDVVSATRSHNRFNPTSIDFVAEEDDLIYEDNFVATFFGGFDWNELAPNSNIILNGRVDIALSSYTQTRDSLVTPGGFISNFAELDEDGNVDTLYRDTISSFNRDTRRWVLQEPSQELDGLALLAELEAGYKQGVDEYKLNVWGIANEAGFVSDLAQSQGFRARTVFNSANRVGLYGMSDYQSMFDALYNYAFTVNPVTERSNLETYSSAEPNERAVGYNGTNNYYRAPYQKNSYTNVTASRSERVGQQNQDALLAYFQDVLPGGKASANRAGFQTELSVDAMDNMISVDGHFGQFANMEAQEFTDYTVVSADYSRYGAGLKLRLGGVLGYKDGIEITAGYGADEATVSAGRSIGRTTNFISGGVKVGFLEDYEFIAGVQILDHDLQNVVVTQITPLFHDSLDAEGNTVIDTVTNEVIKTETPVIDTETGLVKEARQYAADTQVKEMAIAAGLSANIATGTTISAEVSVIEGESETVTYTQVIPQVNLRMRF